MKRLLLVLTLLATGSSLCLGTPADTAPTPADPPARPGTLSPPERTSPPLEEGPGKSRMGTEATRPDWVVPAPPELVELAWQLCLGADAWDLEHGGDPWKVKSLLNLREYGALPSEDLPEDHGRLQRLVSPWIARDFYAGYSSSTRSTIANRHSDRSAGVIARAIGGAGCTNHLHIQCTPLDSRPCIAAQPPGYDPTTGVLDIAADPCSGERFARSYYLPPGGAAEFDLVVPDDLSDPQAPLELDPTVGSSLWEGFWGSLDVRSTEAHSVMTVDLLHDGQRLATRAYRAPAAAAHLYAPAVLRNNGPNHFTSSIVLYNPSLANGACLTMTLRDTQGNGYTRTGELEPDEARFFMPFDSSPYSGTIAALEITARQRITSCLTATQPIAAVVLEAGRTAPTPTLVARAYDLAAGGHATLIAPVVYHDCCDGERWNSQIIVMNTGTVSDTVTVDYYDHGTGAWRAGDSRAIQPRAYSVFEPPPQIIGAVSTAIVRAAGGQPLAGLAHHHSDAQARSVAVTLEPPAGLNATLPLPSLPEATGDTEAEVWVSNPDDVSTATVTITLRNEDGAELGRWDLTVGPRRTVQRQVTTGLDDCGSVSVDSAAPIAAQLSMDMPGGQAGAMFNGAGALASPSDRDAAVPSPHPAGDDQWGYGCEYWPLLPDTYWGFDAGSHCAEFAPDEAVGSIWTVEEAWDQAFGGKYSAMVHFQKTDPCAYWQPRYSLNLRFYTSGVVTASPGGKSFLSFDGFTAFTRDEEGTWPVGPWEVARDYHFGYSWGAGRPLPPAEPDTRYWAITYWPHPWFPAELDWLGDPEVARSFIFYTAVYPRDPSPQYPPYAVMLGDLGELTPAEWAALQSEAGLVFKSGHKACDKMLWGELWEDQWREPRCDPGPEEGIHWYTQYRLVDTADLPFIGEIPYYEDHPVPEQLMQFRVMELYSWFACEVWWHEAGVGPVRVEEYYLEAPAPLVFLPAIERDDAAGLASHVAIRSLSESEAAQVAIHWYDPAGASPLGSPYTLTLPANGSAIVQAPNDFAGSAVVASTVEVAAVAWQTRAGQLLAYSGLSAANPGTGWGQPGQQIYAPLVVWQPPWEGQWQSSVRLQNTGSGEARFDVTYYDLDGNQQPAWPEGCSLVSQTVPLRGAIDLTPDGCVDPLNPGEGFVGSAFVSSTEPLAVVVTQEDVATTTLRGASQYNAFASGSGAVHLPGLMQDWMGDDTWSSSFTVQNAGAATTTVTVTYYNEDGSIVGTCAVTDIGAHASKTVLQSDNPVNPPCEPAVILPDGWHGSARLTAEQPIVAIVSLQLSHWPTPGEHAHQGYSGYLGGGNVLLGPFVGDHYVHDGDRYYSASELSNVGDAATVVNRTYYAPGGEQVAGGGGTSVPAKATATIYLPAEGLPEGFGGSTRLVANDGAPSSADRVVGVHNLARYPDDCTPPPPCEEHDFGASYNLPQWVDRAAPTSAVDDLPPDVPTHTFTVSWHGSDNLAGIADYDVQVCVGAGHCEDPTANWSDWLTRTTATSATFDALPQIYYFRCRARDNAGYVEAWPAHPPYDAFTSVGRQYYLPLVLRP